MQYEQGRQTKNHERG
jgi:hypothetical protein